MDLDRVKRELASAGYAVVTLLTADQIEVLQQVSSTPLWAYLASKIPQM